MLPHPYVTAGEFRRHPTYLDTRNLVQGGREADQDAALTDLLYEASEWADDEINMPLAAHVRTEQAEVRFDRRGRVRYHPEHAPVVTVLGLALGATPGDVSPVVDPQCWTELDGRVIAAYGPAAPGLSSLQFGAPAALGGDMLARWTYVAGYPATQLATDAAAAATSVVVLDSTGIVAGTVLRLWTPSAEEAVTAAAVAGTTVTLTAPLTYGHTAGDSFTALPSNARLAVIKKATAMLLRPAGNAQAGGTPPGAPSPSSTSKDPQRQLGGGAGLTAAACALLANYRRIR